MKQRVIILTIFLTSTLSIFGQDFGNYDTLKALCEGPIFTLCEKMPYLKNGNSSFEDSLKTYLKSINEFPKSGKVSLSLAILRSGEVKYVILREGTIEKLNVIVKAIKSLTGGEWIPGIQNGYVVCCYRPIELEFSDDKVTIRMIGRL